MKMKSARGRKDTGLSNEVEAPLREMSRVRGVASKKSRTGFLVVLSLLPGSRHPQIGGGGAPDPKWAKP